jgi:hypothetical protein
MLASSCTCLGRSISDPVKVLFVTALGIDPGAVFRGLFFDDELNILVLPVRVQIFHSSERDDSTVGILIFGISECLGPISSGFFGCCVGEQVFDRRSTHR